MTEVDRSAFQGATDVGRCLESRFELVDVSDVLRGDVGGIAPLTSAIAALATSGQ